MRVSRLRVRLLHLVTCACPIWSHECNHMRVSHDTFLEFRKQFGMLFVRVLGLVCLLFLSSLSSSEHRMQFRIPGDLCEVSSGTLCEHRKRSCKFCVVCAYSGTFSFGTLCKRKKQFCKRCAGHAYLGLLLSGVSTKTRRFLASCLLRMRIEASMVLVCFCRHGKYTPPCMKRNNLKFQYYLYYLSGHDTAPSRRN